MRKTVSRMWVLIALMTLGLLIFAGCQSNQELSEGGGPGQTVTIDLTDISTTGYTWQMKEEGDGGFEIMSNEVIAGDDNGLAGAPGVNRYQLIAITPGKSTLTFKLARAWEDGEEAYEATYNFTINDDRTVTFEGKNGKSLDGNDTITLNDPVIE